MSGEKDQERLDHDRVCRVNLIIRLCAVLRLP